MPYTTLATSQAPAFVVFLLDISASMSMAFGEQRRIDVVTEALTNTLRQMVFRSARGRRIFSRYQVALYAYNDRVFDVLGGVCPIDKVAKMGVPELNPMATTDTAKGLLFVERLLHSELSRFENSPAPVVCHMTDGIYTGDDPEPVAHRIKAMQVPDGPVLMTNIFLSDEIPIIENVKEWEGITDDTPLDPEKYLYKLRRMSSRIPKSYRQTIYENGYSLQKGSYMLLPASNPELVSLGFQMAASTPIRS